MSWKGYKQRKALAKLHSILGTNLADDMGILYARNEGVGNERRFLFLLTPNLAGSFYGSLNDSARKPRLYASAEPIQLRNSDSHSGIDKMVANYSALREVTDIVGPWTNVFLQKTAEIEAFHCQRNNSAKLEQEEAMKQIYNAFANPEKGLSKAEPPDETELGLSVASSAVGVFKEMPDEEKLALIVPILCYFAVDDHETPSSQSLVEVMSSTMGLSEESIIERLKKEYPEDWG